MSDILPDGMLGDKEIAVKIRSNSHYRNSRLTGQVGMLIGSRYVKGSWANGETDASGMAGYPRFAAPKEGCFYFILLARNSNSQFAMRNAQLNRKRSH